MNAGLFPTHAVQEHTEWKEKAPHQADKPPIRRQFGKTVSVLVLNAAEPEVLEILEWREVKQDHDEEHFRQTKLTPTAALAPRGDQPMVLPFFKTLGKIIKTTK